MDRRTLWLDVVLDARLDSRPKGTKAPTPPILKVAIVIQGLLVVGEVSPHGGIADQSRLFVLLGVTLVVLGVLVALWKMKRWPVIVLLVYALLHAVRAIPWYFHNIALIAAVPYWRRLTWK